MWLLKSLSVLLLCSSQAIALPAPERDSLSCKDVTALVKALHDEPKATSYCSSYLHIHDCTTTVTKTTTIKKTTSSCQTKTITGTATVKSTVTATTTKPAVSTITKTTSSSLVSTDVTTDQTTTTTETISTITASTSTVETSIATDVTTITSITATVTVMADPTPVTVCPGTATMLQARAIQPDCVKPYPSQWISAACSCLHIPTHTSTHTVYKTATCESTVKCTQTKTAQSTTTLRSTVTATAYSTQTKTVTTTVPAITSTYSKTSTITKTSFTDTTATFVSTTTSTIDFESTTIFLTSTVITVTPPGTTTTTCAPAATCSNDGYQWAYYFNPFGDNVNSGYAQFDPAYFKEQDPLETDDYTNIGLSVSNGGTGEIYNDPGDVSFNNFALNHRGYIYAPDTGTYTITISAVDDIVDVWIGSLAYSGWARFNNQAEAARYSTDGAATFTFPLVAGSYTAFRVMFGQGGGPGAFVLTLTAPDGSTLLAQSTADKPGYIVPYSCDFETAPPYPPFGQET